MTDSQDDLKPEQFLAMDEELRFTHNLLIHGLGTLQNITFAVDTFRVPLHHLSQGFERLFKCILAFRGLEKNGTYPEDIAKYQHDLLRMHEDILEHCFTEEYFKHPIAEDDHAFLTGDNYFREALRIFHDYAQGEGRYYELDLISGGETSGQSPGDMWGQLETDVCFDLGIIDSDDPTKPIGEMSRVYDVIIGQLERALSAYYRLFTLGPLGEEARSYLPALGAFLTMQEEEYGTTDYRKVFHDDAEEFQRRFMV